MTIFNKNGNVLSKAYDRSGNSLAKAYDIDGTVIFSEYDPVVDYSNYSFTQKWASKGIGSAQGLDIYDGKVFWVQKSGNGSIPSDCYVWNLSDGSQALATQPITVYSGHGNNLCFDGSVMYATSAYTPHVYINTFTNLFTFTLDKTLRIDDGCVDCDACIDETDRDIMWTLGHTGYNTSDPFLISKWDLNDLTANGDGTYSPANLQTISITPPSNRYFQGLKFHDGLIWYGNGNGGVPSYIRAVNPDTGIEEYVIDLNTNTKVEGIAWVDDYESVGGYAMYVGFQGMMLRKYTFG